MIVLSYDYVWATMIRYLYRGVVETNINLCDEIRYYIRY